MISDDIEKKKLEKLVKSCLLEINKLKMELINLENEKAKLLNNDEVSKLKSLIESKESDILVINDSLKSKDSEIRDLRTLIEAKNLKIKDLENFKNSLEDIKKSLENELKEFKTSTLNDYNNKLENTISKIVEKDGKIKSLVKELNQSKTEITELKGNLATKDSILELQRKVDAKENEIKNIKNSAIDAETVKKFENQIKEKDSRIKELEDFKKSFDAIKKDIENDIKKSKDLEISKLNNEIENRSTLLNKKDEEINSLLNKIKDKDNLIKELLDEDSKDKSNTNISNDDNCSDANSNDNTDNIADTITDTNKSIITDNDKNIQYEIFNLKEELKSKDVMITELEEMKNIFNKIIEPPKRDLTSFQSQVLNVLPDGDNTTKDIHEFLRKIVFKDLSYSNLNSILKSLERKGYVQLKEIDKVEHWTKLDIN
ncbi:MAG: coiled-coil domain-containing protein [Methanobacteriaceae archaeon]